MPGQVFAEKPQVDLHSGPDRSWPAAMRRMTEGQRRRHEADKKSREDSGMSLRHYTDSAGCVDPNFVAPPPGAVDACYENYGGSIGEEYCRDPLMGGVASCCFDVQLQNCTTCEVVADDCSTALQECGTMCELPPSNIPRLIVGLGFRV